MTDGPTRTKTIGRQVIQFRDASSKTLVAALKAEQACASLDASYRAEDRCTRLKGGQLVYDASKQ